MANSITQARARRRVHLVPWRWLSKWILCARCTWRYAVCAAIVYGRGNCLLICSNDSMELIEFHKLKKLRFIGLKSNVPWAGFSTCHFCLWLHFDLLSEATRGARDRLQKSKIIIKMKTTELAFHAMMKPFHPNYDIPFHSKEIFELFWKLKMRSNSICVMRQNHARAVSSPMLFYDCPPCLHAFRFAWTVFNTVVALCIALCDAKHVHSDGCVLLYGPSAAPIHAQDATVGRLFPFIQADTSRL